MCLQNQRGQGLIEYVILVALVAVATIGLVQALQKTIDVNLGRIVRRLQGSEGGAPGRHQVLRDSDMSKRDFSDFWKVSPRRGGSAGDREQD